MAEPLTREAQLLRRVEGYISAYVFVEVRRVHQWYTREQAEAVCARCGWRSGPCEGEPYTDGIRYKLKAAAIGGRHTCPEKTHG